MADSTHNVTIKATLDTSSLGSPNYGGSNRSNVSGGGSSTAATLAGSGALIAAALGISGISGSMRTAATEIKKATVDITNILKLAQHTFEALTLKMTELNQRVHAISLMFRQTHTEIDNTRGKLKHVTASIEKSLTAANAAVDKFKKELEKLTKATEEATLAEKARTASIKPGGAGGENAAAVTKNTNAINKHTNALDLNGAGLKRMIGSLGSALALSQLGSGLLRIDAVQGGDTGFGAAGKAIGAIGTIGMYAGAGAGLGTVVPGLGNAVGAVAGALVGLTQVGLEHLADYMDRINKEMEQLSRESEEYAKVQEELRKTTKATLEQIRKDTLKEVLLEASPEMLEETLQVMNENVRDIHYSITNLNSELVLGKIKITDYTALMAKLRDEQARAIEIRDKLQARYDAILDQEMAEMSRQVSNFDYISEILYKLIQLGKEEASTKVMKEGTWDDVLQALAELNQENLFEQSKSKGYLDLMREANLKLDWPAFEEARREFEESQRNLSFGLQMRGGLALALQEIFKEMMTYKGLNIRDFGLLAALGGFGSTSVLGDPMLDLQRELNRLLSEMLRAIRDQDTTARYL